MRVLIVEDNLALVECLRETLATQAHESLSAPDAQSGLDLLRKHPVDLVLLDINLPGGVSGYAACEACKALRPDLPVILMTGAFTSDADAHLAYHVGASGFLRKPFGINELSEAVRLALEAGRTRPPALATFRCRQCGAESRRRPPQAQEAQVQCPNCGGARLEKLEDPRCVAPARSAVGPTPQRWRILVVDNSERFRLYLYDLLTEAGYAVVTARDGQEAFRLAQEWMPDLVITDILLPGVNGITLCQQIKAHPVIGQTPVITMTGLESEKYQAPARRAGADLFLSKPIQADDLFAKIHVLIGRAQI